MNAELPSRAVRAEAPPKITTDSYILHDWYGLQRRVCSGDTRVNDDTIRNLLEVPNITPWKICLQGREEVTGQKFMVEFIAKDGSAHESFDLGKGTFSGGGVFEKLVSGSYFKNAVRDDFQYEEHTFLATLGYSLHSWITIKGKMYPILVTSNQSRIEILIIKGGAFVDLDFDLKKFDDNVLKN